MSEAIQIAREWLASTDCTDGHIVADVLAKAVLQLEELVTAAKEWRSSGEVDLALPKRAESRLLDAIEAIQ